MYYGQIQLSMISQYNSVPILTLVKLYQICFQKDGKCSRPKQAMLKPICKNVQKITHIDMNLDSRSSTRCQEHC